MATRIYTKISGSVGVTPSTWNFANQINPVTVPGTRIQNDGSAMTSKTEATGTTSPTNRAMGRTIIGPLSAQTISGTVKGQMRGSENNAGANATLGLAIKIVKPDGTDRAVLLAQTASDSATAPNELVTSLTNSKFENASESASISLTSQSASDGDYLVIEWGFRSATTTSRNITLSYGNDSATDLPEDTTTTAANNPWWEFSATITFIGAGDLSASGSASLSATGISIFQGDISPAAAVSTSISGGAIVGGAGSASASASASFAGGSVMAGDVSATVLVSTDARGQAIAQSTFTDSSASSGSFSGNGINQSALSSDAICALNASSNGIAQSALTASAAADGSGEGRAIAQTDFTAAAVCDLAGEDRAIVQTVLLADALTDASMVSGGGSFVEGQFDCAITVTCSASAAAIMPAGVASDIIPAAAFIGLAMAANATALPPIVFGRLALGSGNSLRIAPGRTSKLIVSRGDSNSLIASAESHFE